MNYLGLGHTSVMQKRIIGRGQHEGKIERIFLLFVSCCQVLRHGGLADSVTR